jgi:hypothetical protein
VIPPGTIRGTWRVISTDGTAYRGSVHAECVHCGLVRRWIPKSFLASVYEWHRDCTEPNPCKQAYQRDESTPDGNDPQWGVLAAELAAHPELAKTWPKSRVQQVRCWESNNRAAVAERETWRSCWLNGVVP